MSAAPKFQTIPAHEALDGIERDLRFHPCTNPNPQKLTRAQIAFFNEQGYVAPLPVFSPAEILDVRRYFDRLLASVLAAGGTSYSISTAHLKYGRVWDLLTHPAIVGYVKDLLGDNVIGWGSHFFCKMPGDGKRVAWHQDSSYWPLTPAKAVTVWLAIDDADVENGCMRFIPGSHLFGHLTYHLTENDPANVLNQTVENAEQFGKPVDDILPAGWCSIHNDMLLHGSEANTSTRRRCGLTLRYAPADVRAHLDWNQKGVWVSGGDPTGHWANNPRPEQD
jgi:hypothetical protein